MKPTGKRLLLIGALILLTVVVGLGAFLAWQAGQQPQEGVTYQIARAYLRAIQAGDREAVLRLYRADALCPPGNQYIRDQVDAHIALLALARVNDVRIDVEPREGISVLPGSESATLSVRRRAQGGQAPWRDSVLWLVTGPPDADRQRFICHLGGGPVSSP